MDQRWPEEEISRVGFEVVHFRGLLGPIASSLQVLQDTARGKVPYRLRKYFVFAMQWLVQRTDQWCSEEERQLDACVYVVLAVKRA